MKFNYLLFFTLILSAATNKVSAQDAGSDPVAAQKLRANFQSGANELSNYNTACYFASSGDRALALVYLKKSIYDDGYANPQGLVKDTDLLSLHNDPLWADLVKGAQVNVAKNEKVKTAFYNQSKFWNPAALQSKYQLNLSDEEKVAGLSQFWSEAKYNFVNFDLIPHLNFDSLYVAYLPKVKNTKSTLDYYRLMIQFCAALKDGHTNVFAPDELNDQIYARPLLRSRLIEGKVILIGVYDMALQQQGIKPGLEVISVNGQPVKEYAAQYVIPYQSASTPQDMDARAYEYGLFSGDSDQPIRLQLKNAGGTIKDYMVSRVKYNDRSKRPVVPPFEYNLLKGNIAYVALNGFDTDSAARAFARNFDVISKADGIIFDVRANGGGSSSVGWKILSYLIDKPTPITMWYTRDYKPSYRPWNRLQSDFGSSNTLQPDGKQLYTKPVVVLTSSRTYSAAEDFASAFKSLGRGLILGQPSGGSSGQPLTIKLSGNGSARICTKRDMLANGDQFVGVGVQPDHLVAPTVADMRKGVDTELEAAMKLLKK